MDRGSKYDGKEGVHQRRYQHRGHNNRCAVNGKSHCGNSCSSIQVDHVIEGHMHARFYLGMDLKQGPFTSFCILFELEHVAAHKALFFLLLCVFFALLFPLVLDVVYRLRGGGFEFKDRDNAKSLLLALYVFITFLILKLFAPRARLYPVLAFVARIGMCASHLVFASLSLLLAFIIPFICAFSDVFFPFFFLLFSVPFVFRVVLPLRSLEMKGANFLLHEDLSRVFRTFSCGVPLEYVGISCLRLYERKLILRTALKLR
mmetsp:Transcript_10008/g.19533  ORF Transcript_10008/g.19533 Transcript_10008/m.19533 type:complete len:260 (-) Transcript_10008:400-1179(-)